MNSKTSKALEGSIKKWEKILSGKGTDEGRDNCPLCTIFIKRYISIYDCKGCPVKDRTKFRKCRGSPYVEWEDHQNLAHRTVGKVKCDICKNLALKELEFLKSLRPKAKEMK
jgi:hypothetical protein